MKKRQNADNSRIWKSSDERFVHSARTAFIIDDVRNFEAIERERERKRKENNKPVNESNRTFSKCEMCVKFENQF